MADPVYDVVAAFAARLASLGVTDAVISPGSRSGPLALCFHAQPRIRTWVQLDERAAGFFALGLGRATGRPAVLMCTSGTAAANYLPAVVEASHAGVGVIVCTADRPPELRGWGSPQTIDQVGLYGTAARWSIDLPVPGEASVEAAIGWAETAVRLATGSDPGPVHLNWPLREPLEPLGAVPVPEAGDTGRDDHWDPADPASLAGLASLAEIVAGHGRGVVVAGPWPAGGLDRELEWAAEARRFAAWAGWPLIGEPITHVRGRFNRANRSNRGNGDRGHGGGSDSDRPNGDRGEELPACVVASAEHLLADGDLAEALRPDAAVLVGRTVTTKPVRLWLERTRPRHVVLVDPEDRWKRAVFRLTGHVPARVESLGSITAGAAPPGRDAPGGWLDTWARLDMSAREAVEAVVAGAAATDETANAAHATAATTTAATDQNRLLSARASRVLVSALPEGAVLMATNSLPVRDLDAFVFDTGSVVCCANRGAAGIDGSASTALGIAAADPSRPVALYTGDLALLHDLSGLAAAARLGLHLITVCVDNDGGEIFSLLPVADRVPADDFERLFRTPHGLDLCGLDGFAGIRAARVSTATELDDAVRAAASARAPGVDLLVVEINRDEDVAQRGAVTAAAQQAAHRGLVAGRASGGR